MTQDDFPGGFHGHFPFSSFLTLLSLVLHLPRVHVVIPGPYSSSGMAHQQQACCAPQ